MVDLSMYGEISLSFYVANLTNFYVVFWNDLYDVRAEEAWVFSGLEYVEIV